METLQTHFQGSLTCFSSAEHPPPCPLCPHNSLECTPCCFFGGFQWLVLAPEWPKMAPFWPPLECLLHIIPCHLSMSHKTKCYTTSCELPPQNAHNYPSFRGFQRLVLAPKWPKMAPFWPLLGHIASIACVCFSLNATQYSTN